MPIMAVMKLCQNHCPHSILTEEFHSFHTCVHFQQTSVPPRTSLLHIRSKHSIRYMYELLPSLLLERFLFIDDPNMLLFAGDISRVFALKVRDTVFYTGYYINQGWQPKNPPKKTHLKKPTQSGFFWVFLFFFGFQRKSLYFIPYTIISFPNKLFAFF